jgi:hypothetical protein
MRDFIKKGGEPSLRTHRTKTKKLQSVRLEFNKKGGVILSHKLQYPLRNRA